MKHDCEAEVRSFAEKLGARARHVVFLLGAGASCAANLPSFRDLKQAVGGRLAPRWREGYERLGKERNLEEILTHVRLVAEVLRNSNGEIDGLSVDTAVAMDTAICTAIARAITESAANLEHHEHLARWVASTQYSRPVEIFTTKTIY